MKITMSKMCLIFLCFWLLTFCNKNIEDKYSEIKVGMTYEEVEKVLNKPVSITRGVNELYYDISNIPYDSLKLLNWDTSNVKLVPNRWLVQNTIRTIGQLIYVNWIYDSSKKDTFFVLFNTFKQVYDTILHKTPVYFLGDRKVSKREYENSDGYDYWLPNYGYVDKGLYNAYKESGLYKNLKEPKKVEPNIKYLTNAEITTNEVKDSTVKINYEVTYKYCVIFDSSSGRVTFSDYYPFFVYKL